MKRLILFIILMLSLMPISSAVQVDIETFSDAMTSKASPDANQGTATFLYVWLQGTDDYESFLNFSTSSIPSGSTITSATINFYANIARPLYIDNVTVAWTELGVTWNNKPPVSTRIATITPSTGWNYNIDIKNQFTSWYNGSVKNNGLRFGPADSSGYALYASRESATIPYIRVVYTPFTVNPSNYSLSGYLRDFDTNNPINQAKIFVTNNFSTYSEEIRTNEQGYWNTSNLSLSFNVNVPSTFYVQASKTSDYETTEQQPVTVSGMSPSWKNMTMQKCKGGSYTCGFTTQYVTFFVVNATGEPLSDVLTSIYQSGTLVDTAKYTSSYDGSVTFLLVKEKIYQAAFTKGNLSAAKTFYPMSTYALPCYTQGICYIVKLGTNVPYLNGLNYNYTHNQTSVIFNVSDPNSVSSNLRFRVFNGSTLLYDSNHSGTTIQSSYAPAGTNNTTFTSYYIFTTTDYGNISGSFVFNLRSGYSPVIGIFNTLSSEIKSGILIVGVSLLILIGSEFSLIFVILAGLGGILMVYEMGMGVGWYAWLIFMIVMSVMAKLQEGGRQ